MLSGPLHQELEINCTQLENAGETVSMETVVSVYVERSEVARTDPYVLKIGI